MGDHNGIGPEVALKSALSPIVRGCCSPVLVGSLDVFELWAKRFRRRIILREIESSSIRTHHEDDVIPVLSVNRFSLPRIVAGRVSGEAGAWAGRSIVAAARLCLNHSADAMVTAPVSKKALTIGGYKYDGQTNMLADICGERRFAMMLIARTFRVSPVTIHVPLKRVSNGITAQAILMKVEAVYRSLRKDFAIRQPRVAILGLNPHAGEGGLLGSEESNHILPAVRRAKQKGIRIDGPFPADGFFGRHLQNEYDTVIAMYHDQGLIPLKMMGFRCGVNFTAGLPLVRTSPDHGTAFDIAGKGIADPTSMVEAIKLAVTIVKNRRKGR
jgi:4-hydroxythreonine-4-phosphate dehydrogenase